MSLTGLVGARSVKWRTRLVRALRVTIRAMSGRRARLVAWSGGVGTVSATLAGLIASNSFTRLNHDIAYMTCCALAILFLVILIVVGIPDILPWNVGLGWRRRPNLLVVMPGTLAADVFPLCNQAITIGRSATSTLVLADQYISQLHAQIFPYGGNWFIEDKGSTNGTYVNGARITQVTELPANAIISIGKTRLKLRR
jgi:hypothetical protein